MSIIVMSGRIIHYIMGGIVLFVSIIFVSDVNAAVLFSSPSNGILAAGDTFFLEIRLDTQGEEVNAAEVIIRFSNEIFEVLDATNGGSFLTLWPHPPFFSNATGVIEFSAGTPTGFSGKDGLIGKILFKALKPVERAVISLENGRALLNDGEGTPAAVSYLESSFIVRESGPVIPGFSSSSHPDQLQWYQSRTPRFHWDVNEGSQYSYLLSRDAFGEPDDIPDEPVGDIKYDNLEDGIYYFVLQEVSATDTTHATVSRYRVMIDATPPEEFEVKFTHAQKELGENPFLSFSAHDATSGLERYELCYTDNQGELSNCREVDPPTVLNESDTEERKIVVQAFDGAGNIGASIVGIPRRSEWRTLAAAGAVAALAIIFFKILPLERIVSFFRIIFRGA